MKRLLLPLMLLVASLASFAHDFEVEGIYYNILSKDDLTCRVTYRGSSYSNRDYSGDVAIPAQVTNEGVTYSVTSIGGAAFYGCSGLTSITLPNSVTSIGGSAFSNCSKLTSVTIPKGVTSIGNGTLSGCSGLTSIIIPEGVTSIGDGAFSGCPNLPAEEGIRYADCVAVEAIDKDQTTYSIKVGTRFLHSAVFSGCSNLTSITLPNSVTSIGGSAFASCSGLTSITLPNGVTSIGYYAFRDCSSLTSITIPNSVTSIGERAFWGCSGLSNITIPNSVTSIEGSAFAYCTGLTSITLPNSVTSIEGSAFYGCTGLTSITIPNSVTSIGNYAFKGCKLQTIVSKGQTPSAFYVSTCSANTYNHAQLYVPEDCYWDYAYSEWGSFIHMKEFTTVPSAAKVYMIADETGRNYKVYDSEKKELKNVQYTFSLDEDDLGTYWQVVASGAQYYLYNPKAQQYATVDNNGNWQLTPMPVNVEISEVEGNLSINGHSCMMVVNQNDAIITAISNITSDTPAIGKEGKFMENGRILIRKAGKTYNAAGVEL